jgi:hypothetical protein
MIDKTLALTGFVLCTTLATAHADPDPETTPPATPAMAEGADQLTLPRGRLLLDAFVEINLSTDLVFKPFSISPDVWYGATDDITVGLVHSSVGTSGFIGGVGDSLCLAGSSNGCGDVYSNVGLAARYKLKTGPLAWAADGGLFIRHFDPFQLAIKLGIVGRWSSGKLAVELAPNLFFGLTNRTPDAMAMVVVAGNQEVLNLPVTALYTVAPKIAVAVQLGLQLPFQNTGDTYAVPLSIGAHYHVNESLGANLAFSLPRLVGGGDGTGFDGRTLTLGGTYAF